MRTKSSKTAKKGQNGAHQEYDDKYFVLEGRQPEIGPISEAVRESSNTHYNTKTRDIRESLETKFMSNRFSGTLEGEF